MVDNRGPNLNGARTDRAQGDDRPRGWYAQGIRSRHKSPLARTVAFRDATPHPPHPRRDWAADALRRLLRRHDSDSYRSGGPRSAVATVDRLAGWDATVLLRRRWPVALAVALHWQTLALSHQSAVFTVATRPGREPPQWVAVAFVPPVTPGSYRRSPRNRKNSALLCRADLEGAMGGRTEGCQAGGWGTGAGRLEPAEKLRRESLQREYTVILNNFNTATQGALLEFIRRAPGRRWKSRQG